MEKVPNTGRIASTTRRGAPRLPPDVIKRENMELFFEIGCEEIPARFIPPALEDMAARFQKAGREVSLEVSSVKTYGTPRRLILVADGIPERQADRSEVVTGPAVKAAFDDKGNPTKAALGFSKG